MVDSKEAYGEDYNYEEDPEVAAEREREMEAKLERELTNELEEDTIRYCTVLYCTVLYCILLCCTVLYCTILYLLHTIRMMDEIRYGDDTGVSGAGRKDKLSLSLASLFFFSCFLRVLL